MRSEQEIDSRINKCLNKMQAIDEGKEEGDRTFLSTARDVLGWVLGEVSEEEVFNEER